MRELVEEFLNEDNPLALFLEKGFDGAIIGHTQRMNQSSLVTYSVDKIVEIMVERDGMSYEDAIDFFDYNIGGGWLGDGTPMFVRGEY